MIQQITNQPPLIISIFSGDRAEVKLLLENNDADANFLDSEKRSPLHAAAFKGDSEIIEMLVSIGGARVNAKDNKWLSPLHRACASQVWISLY